MVMLFRLQRAWGFLTWGTKGKLATEFMIPFQEYCQELSLFAPLTTNLEYCHVWFGGEKKSRKLFAPVTTNLEY